MMVRFTLAVLLVCASHFATASLPDFATIVEEKSPAVVKIIAEVAAQPAVEVEFLHLQSVFLSVKSSSRSLSYTPHLLFSPLPVAARCNWQLFIRPPAAVFVSEFPKDRLSSPSSSSLLSLSSAPKLNCLIFSTVLDDLSAFFAPARYVV